MNVSVSHFNNAGMNRRATIKTWPDGCVLLALYGRGRLVSARRQPTLSQAREIALNWTRGLLGFNEAGATP